MIRTKEEELKWAEFLTDTITQGFTIKHTFHRKLYRRIAINDYINKIVITPELADIIKSILYIINGIDDQ